MAPYAPPSYGAYGAPPMQGDMSMGATMVSGFKYAYHPQSGDYFNLQSRNAGRWEQFPITLHLTFPEDMNERDRESVKYAVSQWQKYVDITVVDQPDMAKIEITWVTDLGENEELGETTVFKGRMDSLGRYVYDKVVIRLQDPSLYQDVQPGALRSAVMHQMGHALGINTHSDNIKDLMAEPTYRRAHSQIVKKAVRSFASKTLGQFIDIPQQAPQDDRGRVVYPPVDRISKRDLNTLLRLYQ
jgi:predicted Zn-dependent protease